MLGTRRGNVVVVIAHSPVLVCIESWVTGGWHGLVVIMLPVSGQGFGLSCQLQLHDRTDRPFVGPNCRHGRSLLRGLSAALAKTPRARVPLLAAAKFGYGGPVAEGGFVHGLDG